MSAVLNVRPTPAEAAARQRFLDEHWEELLAEYPEQFVAIYNGRVIAAAARVQPVIDQLAKDGIEPIDTIIEFVSKRLSSLVL